jgi:hypothetical protein
MNPTSDDTRRCAALREQYGALLDRDIATGDESERFRKLLLAIVQSYLDDLDLAAAVGLRIEALERHLAGIEARADGKRRLVAETMSRAGLRTLFKPGLFVECLAAPPPLVIESEAEIPERFWTEGRAALDRDRILEALRAGEAVAGAKFGPAEMTIKVRAS